MITGVTEAKTKYVEEVHKCAKDASISSNILNLPSFLAQVCKYNN